MVPHTRVSSSHTVGALCSALVPETSTVAIVRDTLQIVEFLTTAKQQDAPKKSPIWKTCRSETLESSVIHVAGNVARSARHCARVAVKSPIAIRHD